MADGRHSKQCRGMHTVFMSLTVISGGGMTAPLATISRSVACSLGFLLVSLIAMSRAFPQGLLSGAGKYVLSMLPAETTPAGLYR